MMIQETLVTQVIRETQVIQVIQVIQETQEIAEIPEIPETQVIQVTVPQIIWARAVQLIQTAENV